MDRRAWIGVLVGGLIDVLVIDVLMLPLQIALMVLIGFSARHAQPVPMPAARIGLAVLVFKIVSGTFAAVLGGYVAALIARRNERVAGALSAYLLVGWGIVSVVAPNPSGRPMWLDLIGALFTPLPALLGGYLRLVQRKLSQRAPASRKSPAGNVSTDDFGASLLQDDDALDWLDSFLESPSPATLAAALHDLAEGSDEESIIVGLLAAEIVAASQGHPSPDLLSRLQHWPNAEGEDVDRRNILLALEPESAPLLEPAIQAVESLNQKLLENTGSSNVDNLLDRLRSCRSAPALPPTPP